MRMNALFLPKELHSMVFVSVAPDSAGVYTRSGWTYVRQEIPSGRTDVAVRGGVIASSGPSDDAGYEVRLGDRQVYGGDSVIRDLDLSPDGTQVVFSEMQESEAGPVWMLRRTDGAEVQDIAPGFAGHFLDADTILVFNADGISQYKLTTGEGTSILAYPLGSPLPTAVNAEHRLLAFADPISRDVLVFRLGEGARISAVGGYDVPASASFALSETALFSLEQMPKPATVYRFSLDASGTEKHDLYTLYRPFGIARLTN